MVLLHWFISTLILFERLVPLDARTCPEGQMVVKGGCKDCPSGLYQPKQNNENKCQVCRKCDSETGSEISKDCTSVANRECRCRKGFVSMDDDSSTCKCDRGFGIINGECLKCEVGFFNNKINSPCKEWRKCSTGVNKTGTDTSDNICNKESKTYVTTTTTSNKIVSLNKLERAQGAEEAEGGETLGKQNESTTITVTTKTALGQKVTPKGKAKPLQPADTNIGVLLVTCVIALLILTAVICKLYISPCTKQKRPAVQTQDSLCRRPVEECGDAVSPLSNSIQMNPKVKLQVC
ncbi:LOW QUALITY PROTEIN: uncharacterized protein LOC141789386 [Halichoeres trimaculatus]|uniref:LOW QUALITY PROTEIN: uncharacterized protein LOC141789386 n=1 Tax=Halichoeres trimaculatus TaxID=147232 RepID=UPI003D9E1E14